MAKKQPKTKELNILPFVDIFDAALASDNAREFKARDYIYASEVGMGFYDRYLSMKGVQPSNLPNEIALRKFKLGALIEDFFKLVLYEIGLLHSQEERVMSNFGFGCEVSGRLDVLYGGKWDIKELDLVMEKLYFLDFMGVLSKAIRKFAEDNKKANYDICGLEIKSTSDIMFNRIEARDYPEPHHGCQTFHYAFHKKIPFQLVYFDKNNARMKVFWILPSNTEWYQVYMTDIRQMSEYYLTNTVPPKEKLINFDGEKFSTNWRVEYSKYLTAEYGFNTKMEYKDYATPIVGRWNRVMARIKEGKVLTPDNLLAIGEMRKFGFEIKLENTSETIDVEHEEIVDKKASSTDKLNNLKNLLG